MIDQLDLKIQCIHAIKFALEAFLAAGFLTLCWITAPYWRSK